MTLLLLGLSMMFLPLAMIGSRHGWDEGAIWRWFADTPMPVILRVSVCVGVGQLVALYAVMVLLAPLRAPS